MFSSSTELNLDELLPPAFAAYRPLVRDVLAFFVQRLPTSRKTEIAADQLRLPGNASASVRLVTLLKHCPTLHKLGQVLARDERLTPELRAELRRLESLPATVDVSALRPAIDRAVGNVSGVVVGRRALAEASVATVVPFRWQTGACGESIDGVMKVLKPGIRGRLEQELAVWSELGGFIEYRSRLYGLPDIDYREVVDGVASRLRHEVMLGHEQVHMEEAFNFFQGVSGVRVPVLLPFCTDDVTSMTRINGVKLTDAPVRKRGWAVRRAIDSLIARPLLCHDSRALIHADPHPGNLILTDDDELAILDWSLVARLGDHERRALLEIFLSALALDATRLCRGVEAISSVRPRTENLRQVAYDAIRQLRQGKLPGARWVIGLLDRAVTEAGVKASDDLVLFRKALHTLTGVVDELSSVSAMDRVLVSSAFMAYLSDSVGAMVNPVDAGSTTVAAVNSAVLRLWAETPVTVSRFWLGTWLDLLAPLRA